MAKPIAVFLGPSLPRAEAERLLDADYYPPARHGDIYRLLTSGVRVMALIDGVFHSTPSVWQREVLAALDEGVRVVGAASMGALRAAELQPFGMQGCGTVFAWYRDGVIAADDEVALIHASEELGFKALSQPLVNIRATLAGTVEAGCLTLAEADALVARARSRHFSERSYEMLWQAPELSEQAAMRLRAHVTQHAVDIKARDARLALALAKEQLGSTDAPIGERRDQSIWDAARILGAGLWSEGRVVTARDMVAQAWTQPDLWGPHLVPEAGNPIEAITAELGTRFFALTYARRCSVKATEEELAPWARAFVQRWGIEPTPEHLAANGLTLRAFGEELRARALYDWLLARPGHSNGSLLVTAWAAELGVSLPGVAPESLPAAIVSRGPLTFGYDWNVDVAFARELQLTGLAASVARSLAE